MLYSLLWVAVFVLDLIALVSLLKASADTATKRIRADGCQLSAVRFF